MKRILKIVIGLGLVAYAVYSGNSWFYLGVIPLMSAITNFCPLEKLTGGCDGGSCCTPSTNTSTGSSCCSNTSNQEEKTNCCNTTEIKNETSNCCSTSDEAPKSPCCSSQKPTNFSANKIEILGTGCAKCIALEKVVIEAVNQMQLHIPVVKVSDVNEIMKYQVMSTPGLVINGVVKSTGKLLNVEEVKALINGASEQAGKEIKTKCCGN